MKKIYKSLVSLLLCFILTTAVFGFTPVYASNEPFTNPMISAMFRRNMALRDDGTVFIWGYNRDVGPGTANNFLSPVQVQGLTNIIEVAQGIHHYVTLRSDGTVWSWGSNGTGQIGNGDRTSGNVATPAQVVNLNDIIAISAGGNFTTALRSDGTVWAWGSGNMGQRGDGVSGGTDTSAGVPVQVQGINNIIAISSGSEHTLALRSNGTVWAWGNNGSGQVDSSLSRSGGENRLITTPVQVQGLNDITAIAAGRTHSMALRSDGTVWSWGQSNGGRLGDGTSRSQNNPVRALNLDNIVAISASNHSVALRSDGTVWSWGENSSGQLGLGTIGNPGTMILDTNHTPAQIPNLRNITSISAGGDHTVALRNDGTVWAWGWNTAGEVGDGTTVQRSSPVQVTGVGGSGFINLGQSSLRYSSRFNITNVTIPDVSTDTMLTMNPNFHGSIGNELIITASFNSSTIAASLETIEYRLRVAPSADAITIHTDRITFQDMFDSNGNKTSTLISIPIVAELAGDYILSLLTPDGLDVRTRITISHIAGLFYKNSSVYNHELATLGIELSHLAYNNDEEGQLHRRLESLGINPAHIVTNPFPSEDAEDRHYVEHTIAAKPIFRNGREYNLIFVVVRGTASGAEWLSNLTPGLMTDEHLGFYRAMSRLALDINSYIFNSGFVTVSNPNIFFITGHSRGGAVANLLAARMIRGQFGPGNPIQNDIFTYTFASPNVTTNNRTSNAIYNRIFNVINTSDPITDVPLDWSRYGTDIMISMEPYIDLIQPNPFIRRFISPHDHRTYRDWMWNNILIPPTSRNGIFTITPA